MAYTVVWWGLLPSVCSAGARAGALSWCQSTRPTHQRIFSPCMPFLSFKGDIREKCTEKRYLSRPIPIFAFDEYPTYGSNVHQQPGRTPHPVTIAAMRFVGKSEKHNPSSSLLFYRKQAEADVGNIPIPTSQVDYLSPSKTVRHVMMCVLSKGGTKLTRRPIRQVTTKIRLQKTPDTRLDSTRFVVGPVPHAQARVLTHFTRKE